MKKSCLLSVLAIAGIIFAFGGMAQADLSDGLVAYYPFNGNANDKSVNGNDGEVNGATLTEDRFGNAYSAYSFDGIDDFISIMNSSLLESNNISVEMRVRSSNPGGSFRYILAKGAKNCSFSSYAFYTGVKGSLYFYISDGNTYILSPSAYYSDIWDGEWHHIAGTFNGSIVRLYIDGTEVGNGTTTDKPIGYDLETTNDLFVGSLNDQICDSYNTFFTGSIDNIHIYNRPLSESEIQALYNETSEDETVTDSDSDGVPYIWDECPDTPANSFTNSQGCSAEQLGLIPDDGFTQADIDAAVQACIDDPSSCGIYLEYPTFSRTTGVLDIPTVIIDDTNESSMVLQQRRGRQFILESVTPK
ncbi:LamG domain-containing protein [Desulfobacula phenolica]|uniref:Concanavalin A-like lectin/glucanases superfamily protein n=1 Tax=Desulfobacula phenolica TaxID=90732 RepID=A0A1H2KE81_9BACT|nr:LamG domain-containing protein [Desulfobacula phenolica]SDU66615.1 Concanavalin A-like lectin/glucanases superfamily protein [Desulfobacula phenolica]